MVNAFANVNVSSYGNNSGAVAYVDIVFTRLGIVSLNKNVVTVCSSENGANAFGSSLRLFCSFFRSSRFNGCIVSGSFGIGFFNRSRRVIGRRFNNGFLNRCGFVGRSLGNVLPSRGCFIRRSLVCIFFNRRSLVGRYFGSIFFNGRFRLRLVNLCSYRFGSLFRNCVFVGIYIIVSVTGCFNLGFFCFLFVFSCGDFCDPSYPLRLYQPHLPRATERQTYLPQK